MASPTTIASGSNGQSLPQSTINVASTSGFASSGSLYVQTSAGYQLVTYTGITGTSFTGCAGGTGTMSTGGNVGPAAVIGSPFSKLLQFDLLTNLRGFFTAISATEPSNPKGICFSQSLRQLIVSVSPWNHATPDTTQKLLSVGLDGTVATFTPSASPAFGMHRNVESKPAAVPQSGPPISTAGFTAGDIFVPGGQFLTSVATTIASGSNGQSLPQSTINVASTTGFASSGNVFVQTSVGWQRVTYTGTTSTSFTGCSGGTGTMSTGNGVHNCSTNSIYRITGNPAAFSSGYPIPWADQIASGGSQGLWGGLTFDTNGSFGGQLIAVSYEGDVFIFNSSGAPQYASSSSGAWIRLPSILGGGVFSHVEGCAVAPSTFGPYAGWLLIGVENDIGGDSDPYSGQIYAIQPTFSGTPIVIALANIGFGSEALQFAPAKGGMYFQTAIDFWSEARNRIWSVSAGQFLAYAGRLFAVNEMSGELWAIWWDSSASLYRQSYAGRVPGSWSSGGWNLQGTETEGACFAEWPPTAPDFGSSPSWNVPGNTNFLTSQGPAACVAPTAGSGNNWGNTSWKLWIAALCGSTQGGYTSGRIYFQNSVTPNLAWPQNWTDTNANTFFTPGSAAPAVASQDTASFVYIFAVDTSGALWWANLANLGLGWSTVPGTGTCASGTGPSVALVNGRLILCQLLAAPDNQIALYEFGLIGRAGPNYGLGAVSGWGWTSLGTVPNSSQMTTRTPTVVQFQGDLWVICTAGGSNPGGFTTDSIVAISRTPTGAWGAWGNIPGGGLSSVPVGAGIPPDEIGFLSANLPRPGNAQLALAVRGQSSSNCYLTVASPTGSWNPNGWPQISGGSIQGPPAVAVIPVNNSSIGTGVYVFAKGNSGVANVYLVHS